MKKLETFVSKVLYYSFTAAVAVWVKIRNIRVTLVIDSQRKIFYWFLGEKNLLTSFACCQVTENDC